MLPRDIFVFGLFMIGIYYVLAIDEIPTTMESDLEQAFAEVRRNYERFKNEKQILSKDEKQLKIDREKFIAEKESIQSNDKTDVIQLNIGGEIMVTTRQTLIAIPKSLFSILFDGRWETDLVTDELLNIFFDFNPTCFRHLLDQLQLSDLKSLSPPSDPSLIRSYKRMLKQLRLEHLLSSSDKTIITVNVDGKMITTEDKSIIDKTNSFFDYHPRVFRHFVKFRREQKFPRTMFTNWTTSHCKSFQYHYFVNLFVSFLDKQISVLTMPENNLQKREFDAFKNSFMKDIQQLRTQIADQRENSKKQFTDLNDKTLCSSKFKANTKWKQYANTIAGGNGEGNQSNQFNRSQGISIDHKQQIIYIADSANHRIVKWKLGENNGEIIAGGNGEGNMTDQLNWPIDVIFDQSSKSLIICDSGNRRVVRWPLNNKQKKQIIIENIKCWELMMNENGDLFVSDTEKNEVTRWRQDGTEGIIVAGGNGKGDQLNQLNFPAYIFIDREDTVYVSDSSNHRIMKWLKGAKEGIVVAGGQGKGNSLKQLDDPSGVIVNEIGDIFVADNLNYRIVCWSPGSKEGRVIVGGNGYGQGSNQFNGLRGLSFDHENNLYVIDYSNNRIQQFEVDKN